MKFDKKLEELKKASDELYEKACLVVGLNYETKKLYNKEKPKLSQEQKHTMNQVYENIQDTIEELD
jgi:hypothetical protein